MRLDSRSLPLFRFLVTMLAALSAGCSSKAIKLTDEDRELFFKSNRPVARVLYKTQNPSVWTKTMQASGAVGGLIGLFSVGAASGGAASEELSAAIKIDPTKKTYDAFMAGLSKGRKPASLEKPPRSGMEKDDIGELQKELRSGLVLDLKTTKYWFGVRSVTDGDFHLEYAVRGRLIDLEAGKILWQSECKYVGDEAERQLEWAKMVDPKEEGAHKMIEWAAAECGKTLVSSFYGTESN